MAAEFIGSNAIQSAASGSIDFASLDASGVGRGAVVALGGMIYHVGATLAHRSSFKKTLPACISEYCEAGLLEVCNDTEGASLRYQTTEAYKESLMSLNVYPDIKSFIATFNYTAEELCQLGFESTVTIHMGKDAIKKLGGITPRLSASCVKHGIKDYTKTDAEKRLASVSFIRMGSMALQNAFVAEGDRRTRGVKASPIPVLSRVLAIAMMCGIHDITTDDIVTILGKSPIFETVARERVAKLRGLHASEVFNHALFQGSTESVARGFPAAAPKFTGDKVVVAEVTGGGIQIVPAYARSFQCCYLKGPYGKKYPTGTPVYMLSGWVNLMQQRYPPENQHSGGGQLFRFSAPTKAVDVHGNKYMSGGSLSDIKFKIKECVDGTLMAKPQDFGRFTYRSRSDVGSDSAATSASGEEKLFGGIVGPAVCACGNTAVPAKGTLTAKMRLGAGLRINSEDTVGNSIKHTKRVKTDSIGVLWRPGDWAMGCFFMQILPQSSYLQGLGQCLYCAVEAAALFGCPEVIACGGGTGR
ncbi:hypothetical protein H2202_005010 [Exophiala xenobiotica]|nr:hypothetical protein H2202_005010 [Exophiala xenobiotica]KAK5216237.1 hypothetical protein LTR72_010808 [Exophiala xenobiotica]KAK5233326.1 hypothetical protein LTR47_005419 [Exophiala xenobiotica]KAK5246575.1 hypothetical protein LTS06_008151 [Exophiala xenobiotica]KAK5285672.1 hypothetical protein LTR14_010787 [Exophiala xenobiotica]